eukprot:6308899-Amphidinium_carterae.1
MRSTRRRVVAVALRGYTVQLLFTAGPTHPRKECSRTRDSNNLTISRSIRSHLGVWSKTADCSLFYGSSGMSMSCGGCQHE